MFSSQGDEMKSQQTKIRRKYSSLEVSEKDTKRKIYQLLNILPQIKKGQDQELTSGFCSMEVVITW